MKSNTQESALFILSPLFNEAGPEINKEHLNLPSDHILGSLQ